MTIIEPIQCVFGRVWFLFDSYLTVSAADRSRGQFILTAPSPFKDVVTSHSIHSLHNISVSDGIQQLENILNLGIHFNTYADVFEDIASLPTNQLTDCDFHSDQEEIIWKCVKNTIHSSFKTPLLFNQCTCTVVDQWNTGESFIL